MTEPTIRALLETIRDEACEEYQSPDLVSNPELIRRIYSDAVAALALIPQVHELLNQGRDHKAREILGGWPDPGSAATHKEPVHESVQNPDGTWTERVVE